MPLRKYHLVGDITTIDMRQKQPREKHIRSVSITSDGYRVGNEKNKYFCEVSKSPRAPEYIVHYGKMKGEGINMVKHKPRKVRQRSDKDTRSDRSQPTDDDEKLNSETTDKEKEDMVGLPVIACNRQDGLYYPGHVSHTPKTAYAIVNFNYHKKQKVCTEMIIPMSGAIPWPELAPGDFVLVKAYNRTECFVPGIVEVTPEDFRRHAKFYSILLYNGQRDTALRISIVKIGKSRFDTAIKYIAHIQEQRKLRQESALLENSRRAEDDQSSITSSQSGRGRRKKEKLTEKISRHKEKHRKRSMSKGSRSQSSKSRSGSSRSRSRSRSSRSRSRNSRSWSSRSRSRSSSRSSRLQSERSQSSRSRSRSYERSRQRSSMEKRKNSVSSSRSRSRSSSSSTIRSRSSVQRSRPKSVAAKRTSSRSSSRDSRSRTSPRHEDSATPRAPSPYERPLGPTPDAHAKTDMVRTDSMTDPKDITRKDIYNVQQHSSKTTVYVNVDEKDEVIHNLQHQLEKQQRKQLRQERRLVRQARKINKIQRKLHDSDVSHNTSGHSVHTDRSERNKNQRSTSPETDTSPQRRKGSPDGISYRDSPDLQTIRRSSPGLQINQEVLARWQDDGWYYRGCVVTEVTGDKYIIRDSTGHTEAIFRDDILTEGGERVEAIQPEDHIIGLHPNYVYSYAPAEVLSTYSNGSLKVEFYDGNMADLTMDDVYKVSEDKYKQVLDYIKRSEKRLIGESVIARDDTTGLYKLGIVDSRVGRGQKYYIKWIDGDMSNQNGNHIFEVAKRQMHHEEWTYALAPTDKHSSTYMPAEVIQKQPLVLRFCDGKRTSDVTLEQCFWLNKDYYNNAREFIIDIRSRQ